MVSQFLFDILFSEVVRVKARRQEAAALAILLPKVYLWAPPNKPTPRRLETGIPVRVTSGVTARHGASLPRLSQGIHCISLPSPATSATLATPHNDDNLLPSSASPSHLETSKHLHKRDTGKKGKGTRLTTPTMPSVSSSAQKSAVNEFMGVTQADKSTAGKVLKQHGYNVQAAVNA